MLCRFLLAFFILLSTFAGLPLTAAEKCAKVLSASDNTKEIFTKVDAAISADPQNENSQLGILEELLAHPSFVEAVGRKDLVATATLENVLNRGSSQAFYRQALVLLQAARDPRLKSYVDLVNANILPPNLRKVALPGSVFQHEVALDHTMQHTLGAFFDYNPKMSSAAFSRRLFAFMGEHSEFSQEQKTNFSVNLMREFVREKKEYNQSLPETAEGMRQRTYYTFEEPKTYLGDETRFICGTRHCTYFFAITKDGKFFVGNTGPERKSLDYSNWRKAPNEIREALPEG